MKDQPMTEPQQTEALVRRHREMLWIASIVVVLALLFQVRADDKVIVTGMDGLPLPPSCASQSLFGVKCPGCGLTRSFVHLAHGNWTDSLASHRLGWLLATMLLLQFPYRIVALRQAGHSPLGTRFPQIIGYLLIAALIGNWLLEMIHEVGAKQG